MADKDNEYGHNKDMPNHRDKDMPSYEGRDRASHGDSGMNNHEDRAFKQWADSYVEQYGQSLLQEQQMLDQQRINYATPHADARVKQLTNVRKKRRRMPYFAVAAAVMLVFVGAGAALLQLNTQSFNFFPPPQSADQDSSPGDATDNIQELDFALPAQFSVAGVEWDNGETIYYLDNTLYDDAVLTIKASDGANGWMDAMDKIYVDNTPVPAKLRDEYKLVTFESRGSLYTISCRDDIETLSTLYRSVTEQDRQNV